MRLGEILRLAAQRDPGKAAMIAGDRQIDFAEYDAAANRFAHLLLDSGVSKGDRIATVLFNSPEYCVTHFGNARAGSVLAHISPIYAAPEIARIVERTRPRVLVIDAAIADKINAVRDRLISVERVIVVSEDGSGGDFDDAISAFPGTDPKIEIDPADPVAMTFTGRDNGYAQGCGG